MAENTVILFDIDYTLFDTAHFKNSQLAEFRIYEEVLETLQSLGKNITLGIFSEGEDSFQTTKLINTQIHEFFKKEYIHIVKSKDESIEGVFKKYKNDKVILVDDKLTVLVRAKEILPHVYTVWMKRGFYAEKQQPIKGFRPDAIIYSLKEIIEIVSK